MTTPEHLLLSFLHFFIVTLGDWRGWWADRSFKTVPAFVQLLIELPFLSVSSIEVPLLSVSSFSALL